MSDTPVQARLEALKSLQTIETLIYTYAQAFDRRDPALLDTVWADDEFLGA